MKATRFVYETVVDITKVLRKIYLFYKCKRSWQMNWPWHVLSVKYSLRRDHLDNKSDVCGQRKAKVAISHLEFPINRFPPRHEDHWQCHFIYVSKNDLIDQGFKKQVKPSKFLRRCPRWRVAYNFIITDCVRSQFVYHRLPSWLS